MEIIDQEQRQVNSASLFSEEESFIPESSTNVSDFEENEQESLEVTIFPFDKKSKKDQLTFFKSFVEKRIKYLDKLNNLDNWISGESVSPTMDSIEYSKYFLEEFKNWLYANKNIPVPKVIMGPIPAGGISLELRPNSENGLFITVYNNKTLEVDVMIQEEYHSVDLDEFKKDPYILEAYEIMVNE